MKTTVSILAVFLLNPLVKIFFFFLYIDPEAEWLVSSVLRIFLSLLLRNLLLCSGKRQVLSKQIKQTNLSLFIWLKCEIKIIIENCMIFVYCLISCEITFLRCQLAAATGLDFPCIMNHLVPFPARYALQIPSSGMSIIELIFLATFFSRMLPPVSQRPNPNGHFGVVPLCRKPYRPPFV